MKYKLIDVIGTELFSTTLTAMTAEGWTVFGNHSQYIDADGVTHYTVLLSAAYGTPG